MDPYDGEIMSTPNWNTPDWRTGVRYQYKTSQGHPLDRPTARHFRKLIRRGLRDKMRFYERTSRSEEERLAAVVCCQLLLMDFEEVWRQANDGAYFR